MQEIPIPLPTKGPNRTKTNIAHYVMGWASSTMHFSENTRLAWIPFNAAKYLAIACTRTVACLDKVAMSHLSWSKLFLVLQLYAEYKVHSGSIHFFCLKCIFGIFIWKETLMKMLILQKHI